MNPIEVSLQVMGTETAAHNGMHISTTVQCKLYWAARLHVLHPWGINTLPCLTRH